MGLWGFIPLTPKEDCNTSTNAITPRGHKSKEYTNEQAGRQGGPGGTASD